MKMKHRAEFHFSWMLVLWTGLLIFSQIEGMLSYTPGKIAMLVYIIITLYHSIQASSYYLYKLLQYVHKKFESIKSGTPHS
ncbi:hypothetical protein [Bacillus horti]|uniref:Uncharacterized protein n=1 Tax=Caldalkalibacillus horti TaxID=77523 RepID=A0ABT9VUL3_9BACI|nr:hypothetical protein [Bacillus horti]MDQ0164569.1 hypothetical protein [Bacillus horti]